MHFNNVTLKRVSKSLRWATQTNTQSTLWISHIYVAHMCHMCESRATAARWKICAHRISKQAYTSFPFSNSLPHIVYLFRRSRKRLFTWKKSHNIYEKKRKHTVSRSRNTKTRLLSLGYKCWPCFWSNDIAYSATPSPSSVRRQRFICVYFCLV